MISFPWDSIVTGFGDDGYPIYDRSYKSEQLRDVMQVFFSNGVFMRPTASFQVTAGEGMKVIVSPGYCHMQGGIGVERSQREMVFQASSSVDRIDTVVLRWDINIDARSIDLYVKQGVASATPVRPALTRNESVYELGICDVFIPANSTSISQDRITDTRLETERCGVVVPFDDIDTTTFYNQIQAAIQKQIAELQAQTDEAIKLADGALEGTIAGNLQNQVDNKVEKTGDTMTGSLTVGNAETAAGAVSIGVDSSSGKRAKMRLTSGAYATFVMENLSGDFLNFITLKDDSTGLGKPLQLDSGGTGATSAGGARHNLGTGSLYTLGTDVTGGAANDTKVFWANKENGQYWFTKTGMLNGQPGQWCYLLHLGAGSERFQLLHVQSNGELYMRGWNNSVTACPGWTLVSDRRNKLDAYPVGALYLSFASTSPASLFGGTWVQLTGRVLRAANDTNAGGADNITLSVAQMPAHSHVIKNSAANLSTYTVMALSKQSGQNGLASGSSTAAFNGWLKYDANIQNTGSSQSHSNMMAYQDIYCWRRTD